jgi:hypothetical protein
MRSRRRRVIAPAYWSCGASTGSPTRMVIGVWLRLKFFGWPLVHRRWVPHSAIGISGTPASWAMRAAPDLKLFRVKDWEIVASGKTPTISPDRSDSSACW